MKKLIVLTLAIVAGVVANASSVNWAFSSGSAYAGYNLYICSEIASGGFKDVADIQSHLLGTAGNTASLGSGRSAAASGTATVSDAAGSTVNFYYVLVNPNDTTGYWTMASSAEAYTTSSTHTDSNIPTASGTSLLSGTKTIGDVEEARSAGVEEPTS